jgi:hypothetical protein
MLFFFFLNCTDVDLGHGSDAGNGGNLYVWPYFLNMASKRKSEERKYLEKFSCPQEKPKTTPIITKHLWNPPNCQGKKLNTLKECSEHI